jgi:molybdenum cofactor cytidylyltransferase
VLAAGGSARMGEPKQLLKWNGISLVRRAVESVVGAGCEPVVVVLGNAAEAVKQELVKMPVQFARNDLWERGIGSSLRAGADILLQMQPPLDAIVIMLCDQPRVSASTIRRLLDAYETSGKAICICSFAGTIGPPVVVGPPFFPALQKVADPSGAKAVWAGHPEQVRPIPIEEAAFDVDTPQDYSRLVNDCGT